MKTNETSQLQYVNEHLACRNYLKESNKGFAYREYQKGDKRVSTKPMTMNCLVILLSGTIRIDCGKWVNREIKEGEMFLIARSSYICGECITDCSLLFLSFDLPVTNCEKLDFQALAELSNKIDYNLNTLPVRAPVKQFVDLLLCYLSIHANCYHLHEMKQNELFLCLRFFYTKTELASLFHPMLAHLQDFHSFVLENYTKIKSVKELISLSNMSRSVFYSRFSEEFGISAKQWLTEKFMQKIVYLAAEPGISVKKLMSLLDFESLSQFQVYCKRNFGCTPSELINRSIKGNIHFQNRQKAISK